MKLSPALLDLAFKRLLDNDFLDKEKISFSRLFLIAKYCSIIIKRFDSIKNHPDFFTKYLYERIDFLKLELQICSATDFVLSYFLTQEDYIKNIGNTAAKNIIIDMLNTIIENKPIIEKMQNIMPKFGLDNINDIKNLKVNTTSDTLTLLTTLKTTFQSFVRDVKREDINLRDFITAAVNVGKMSEVLQVIASDLKLVNNEYATMCLLLETQLHIYNREVIKRIQSIFPGNDKIISEPSDDFKFDQFFYDHYILGKPIMVPIKSEEPGEKEKVVELHLYKILLSFLYTKTLHGMFLKNTNNLITKTIENFLPFIDKIIDIFTGIKVENDKNIDISNEVKVENIEEVIIPEEDLELVVPPKKEPEPKETKPEEIKEPVLKTEEEPTVTNIEDPSINVIIADKPKYNARPLVTTSIISFAVPGLFWVATGIINNINLASNPISDSVTQIARSAVDNLPISLSITAAVFITPILIAALVSYISHNESKAKNA